MRHSILIWIITLLFLLASASGIDVNSCGTINQDSELNETVSATATCFTIGTSNVTLDCQGFRVNYNSDGESNAGVIATNRDNVTIKNCLINDNAPTTSTGGRGITFTRTNSSVINNTDIIAQGNNGRGLLLTDVHFNIIDTVNITINGSLPIIGINILSSSSDNNISNVNISLINSTTGINLTGITQSSSSGNLFTNIFIRSTLAVVRWITSNPSANIYMNLSLLRAAGDIKFINVNISESFNISHVEITQNNAFVNSSNKTFLNSSARITLSNLSSINIPTVDFEDDGTFVNCPGSICTTVSASASSLVFDVTQFTSYSSTPGGLNVTLTKSDNPDPVNSSAELNYTITINVNNTGNASNVTLTETYPSQVVFISSTPQPAVGNTTFVIGNLTANTTFQVNITVFTNNLSTETNITNTANISFQNASGSVITLNVTEDTTVTAEAVVSPAAPPGGGGGGGGGYRIPGGVGTISQGGNITTLSCFESWSCGGWTECASGLQTRECEDLRACGTTALKPYTSQTCDGESVPIIEPEPVAEEPEPALAPPTQRFRPKTDWDVETLFYALGALALIVLIGYWYFQRKTKKPAHHKK